MGKCEQCIVRELSALKTLNKEELLKIADCKTSRQIYKGETLFKEGDYVNGIYCVRQGVCKVTKLSANGKDQILRLVKKGELLEQRSMIADQPANLTATALQDMQICFIPKSEILGFFATNNKFSLSMVQIICGDLKEADDLIVEMAQKTSKQRLAHTLVYLKDSFGTDTDGSLALQLSREDLAGLIGTATENCIRLLSEFKNLGLIAIDSKKITILNHNALVSLVN